MSKPRTTFKYRFKLGNKTTHTGITNNLIRRFSEHNRKTPKGHVVQIGRRVSRQSALSWRRSRISK